MCSIKVFSRNLPYCWIEAWSLTSFILLCGLASVGVCQDTSEENDLWPREYSQGTLKVFLYQPQPESLDGDLLLSRSAVALMEGNSAPVYGAVHFSVRAFVDRKSRLVELSEIVVREVVLPEVSADQASSLKKLLEAQFKDQKVVFSLEHFLTSLSLLEQLPSSSTEDLVHKPPLILIRHHPAILVLIDGKPRLKQIEGFRLRRVVNTPSLMLLHPPSRSYWLQDGERWFTSKAPLKEWTSGEAPEEVLRYVKERLNADLDERSSSDQPELEVIVSTRPTELIVAEGEVLFAPLTGCSLMYSGNTDSDILLDPATSRHYVLLSGRWFSAADLEGPWSPLSPDQLPNAFREIPIDSPVAHLRTNVAGTEEAKEAVLDTLIPDTAEVERDSVITVEFDGKPQFKKIAGGKLSYALNTADAVVRLPSAETYYCCRAAVWYETSNPLGSWKVCTAVPEVIYTIPPRCPIYHVRYCRVFAVTPRIVRVGYYPGYLGSHLYRGTVVYGTGYLYRPWAARAYYARPVTWGYAVRYNPYTGNWAFAARYTRSFGIYSTTRHAGWWGPAGYYSVTIRRTTIVSTNPPMSIYGNRLVKTVSVRTGSVKKPAVQRILPQGVPGNLFADRNGNVFRPGQNGWETRREGRWHTVGPGGGSALPKRLNQELASQRRAQIRSNNYRSYSSGGRMLRGSSVRGGRAGGR